MDEATKKRLWTCPKCGGKYYGMGAHKHKQLCAAAVQANGSSFNDLLDRHSKLLEQVEESKAALRMEKDRLEKVAQQIQVMLEAQRPALTPTELETEIANLPTVT